MTLDSFFQQLKSEHDRIPQDLPICLFTTCPQVFCYSDSIDRKCVLVHIWVVGHSQVCFHASDSRKGVFVRLSVEFLFLLLVCPPLPSLRGLSQAYTLRFCPLLPLGQNMHSSANKPLTVKLTCVLAWKTQLALSQVAKHP